MLLHVAGLHAVFKYHDTKPTNFGGPLPNMESFHSHVGLATATLFVAQYVAGAYHFIPSADSNIPGVDKEVGALAPAPCEQPVHRIFLACCSKNVDGRRASVRRRRHSTCRST